MKFKICIPKYTMVLLASVRQNFSVVFLTLFFAFSLPTYGTITISAIETENDVIFSVDGSTDVTGINTVNVARSPTAFIDPASGEILRVFPGDGVYAIINKSIPNFGIGGEKSPDEVSGDGFGARGTGLLLPAGYTNQDLDGSMTFFDASFASLGIAPESDFTRTLNLSNGNTDTLAFTTTAIPEPNSYGFLVGAVGLATAVFFRRRRRRE